MISEFIDQNYQSFKQEVDNGEGTYLYHCTDDECLRGILKNGPDRDWTGKNSNTYGTGFYTTFKLDSSEQNSRGHIYGHYIIKFKLIGGFEGFLIFDPEMARKVYGEWNIEKQIEMLCPPDVVAKLKADYGTWDLLMTPEHELSLCHKTGGPRTGPLACAFFNSLKGNMLSRNEMTEFQRMRGAHPFQELDIQRTKIKGYIFQGENDGNVCFVRDFKSIIPVAYRDGSGKWHDALKEETFNKIAGTSDAAFSFRGKYPETSPNEKAIDGFMLVKNNGKFNYVNIDTGEELLPVWADNAYAFDAMEHFATFNIGGEEFKTNGKVFSDEDCFSYDKNEFAQEMRDRGLLNESSIKITETEIKQMVQECLKRIINTKKPRK